MGNRCINCKFYRKESHINIARCRKILDKGIRKDFNEPNKKYIKYVDLWNNESGDCKYFKQKISFLKELYNDFKGFKKIIYTKETSTP